MFSEPYLDKNKNVLVFDWICLLEDSYKSRKEKECVVKVIGGDWQKVIYGFLLTVLV